MMSPFGILQSVAFSRRIAIELGPYGVLVRVRPTQTIAWLAFANSRLEASLEPFWESLEHLQRLTAKQCETDNLFERLRDESDHGAPCQQVVLSNE